MSEDDCCWLSLLVSSKVSSTLITTASIVSLQLILTASLTSTLSVELTNGSKSLKQGAKNADISSKD